LFSVKPLITAFAAKKKKNKKRVGLRLAPILPALKHQAAAVSPVVCAINSTKFLFLAYSDCLRYSSCYSPSILLTDPSSEPRIQKGSFSGRGGARAVHGNGPAQGEAGNLGGLQRAFRTPVPRFVRSAGSAGSSCRITWLHLSNPGLQFFYRLVELTPGR